MARIGNRISLAVLGAIPLPLLAAGGAVTQNESPAGAAANQATAAGIPVLQPELVTIDPALEDDEERNNLSGAACTGDGACLMIGDEKRYARLFTLTGSVLAPGDAVYLLPRRQPDGSKETDGEGIAYANGFFYLIGSHSRGKTGEAQGSRHFLYRIPIDARTQRPPDLGSPTTPAAGVERRTLDPIINGHPLLSRHLVEPPGDTINGQDPSHGVNIEGIAIAGDDMFIGFRGPVDGDGAVILRLSASGLFNGPVTQAETHRLNLGAAQGIRDMAAVNGGLLILAGPERRNHVEPNPVLFFWQPNRAPVPLGRLARQAGDDNPESITLLEETSDAYRLLVLWDGDAGGVPMIVRVPKRGI